MGIHRVVVAAIVSLAVLQPVRGAEPERRAPRAVPGELIVKYRPGTDEAGRARARRGVAAVRKHRVAGPAIGSGETELVAVPGATDPAAAISALERDPAVEFAEPNFVYTRFTTPNDPQFPQLWGLHNTGQAVAGRVGVPDADIDAPEAWSTALGSPHVYVVMLDEGVDTAHQDLGGAAGPIWMNPYDPVDGVDNDGNGYIDDAHGWDFFDGDNSVYDGNAGDLVTDAHGTHCAGIIGARANNGVGVTGIAWDVRVIVAKFLGPNGGTADGAVRAIDYIVDLKTRHGLDIVAINASWGSSGASQALQDAIVRAARADILLVTAAGNGGADQLGDDNDAVPQYPASYDTTAAAGYDSVISVTATGPSDELATFANYGVRSVHLGAPGVNILSTTPQSRYEFDSGTSMATPYVTGAAAVVSAATALTGRDLRARLLASVDPVPALQGRTTTGGRLNLRNAVSGQTTTAPPAGTLPGPWQSQDVGAVGAAGHATANGSTFSVAGAGADVWGTADAFHFAYQPLNGDGRIIARVASVQNTAAWTKAGVMIRASLTASSAHAFMLVSAGKGVAFQRRAADGGSSVSTAGSTTTAPRWVRLDRSGGTVTASESADGTSWTILGSSSIALGTTAYVGLAVSSHVAGIVADAAFDSVSIAGGSTAAWSNRDVGAVGRPGAVSPANGTFTLSASGTDIWGSADQFHYMYAPLAGDGVVIAHVAAVDNTNVWVKAGVMIRESLDPASPHAFMLVTPGGTKGLAFQRRVTAGGLSTSTSAGGGTPPAWVKLVRAGNTISAYRSTDGMSWNLVGSDAFAMGSTVYAGLALSSHDNTVLATATFDQVTLAGK